MLFGDSLKALLMILLFLLLTGFSNKTVEQSAANNMIEVGDKVLVNYTCAFEDTGEIVTTTLLEVDEDSEKKKWAYYAPPQLFKPVYVTAKSAQDEDESKIIRNSPPGFGSVITEYISKDIVGKQPGSSAVFIDQGNNTKIAKRNSSLTLPRKRRRAKWVLEDRREREYFRDNPPMENEIVENPVLQIYWKALSVNATHVKGIVLPKTYNRELNVASGNPTLEETDEWYYIVLHPKRGEIARFGSMMGLISNVTDEKFSVDFRHPYAYKALKCNYDIVPGYIEKKRKK